MDIPETVWAEAKEIANNWAMPETEQACAEMIARAILAERERCALIAEDDEGMFTIWGEDRNTRVAQQVARDISQAIRNPLHKQT